MKRLMDIALVALTSPLWVPLMVLVAVVVAISMGRPLFFVQDRAGLNGKVFRFLKFRTMNSGEGTDLERMTRTGRILRATSLDELPQLLHVLSGKMSLVGPRPLPAVYLPRYSSEQMRRHEVRPGLTGWAQINGRNAISWEDKFRLDVWYVENRSLWLDIRILAATVLKVLARSGINRSADETMGEFLGSADV